MENNMGNRKMGIKKYGGIKDFVFCPKLLLILCRNMYRNKIRQPFQIYLKYIKPTVGVYIDMSIPCRGGIFDGADIFSRGGDDGNGGGGGGNDFSFL